MLHRQGGSESVTILKTVNSGFIILESGSRARDPGIRIQGSGSWMMEKPAAFQTEYPITSQKEKNEEISSFLIILLSESRIFSLFLKNV
jgi:hypothetical protein